MSEIDKSLDRLKGVRRTANGWEAFCPGHDDVNKRSLSVGEGSDGKVLLNCFAGCSVEEIVFAIGLSMTDLFPQNRNGKGGPINPSNVNATLQRPGCTLAHYAENKKLPIEFLRNLGLSDITYMGVPAVRIPYSDEFGAEGPVRIRSAMEGENKFRWRKGSKHTFMVCHVCMRLVNRHTRSSWRARV